MTRKNATRAVVDWIIEARGEDAASAWAWNATPMPCGLPSDKQLDEGLRVATGELDVWELIARCEEEMAADMAAFKAADGNGAGGEKP